ncbi:MULTISPECIES: hypothetical protein [unclassified Bartonella]
MAWSLIFIDEGAGRMVVARDMFLKLAVFSCVVGLAYNGAKHMGGTGF